ncbi:tetratricopeptide repeat protein [Luteolibacter arcticus]|uniref:Tetratricopeptide repeat protein n=1 Tax=Luteolibacter arcticus TaxID=1581411 RepID=A0ABT3GRZ6_9BACT|nr:tetratricopeptide repeat protein [Luteolibacter arcticus]MCW1926246.1 tetratricopeptide repeat protein [Luteolibacter arcticus]
MKPLLIGGSITLAFAAMACKRASNSAASSATTSSPPSSEAPVASPAADQAKAEAEAEAKAAEVADAKRERFRQSMESGYASFRKKDIAGTFATLEGVPDEFKSEPEFINLRGACHVENRDFAKALNDFSEASRKSPEDASVRFNLAEVYFVTRRWDEAIEGFQQAKQRAGADSDAALRALIDFKLMLCEAGKGDAEAFDRLAAANVAAGDSLLAAYTRAAMGFHSGDENGARDILADAAEKFPQSSERAPWHDTMIEFGYLPRP